MSDELVHLMDGLHNTVGSWTPSWLQDLWLFPLTVLLIFLLLRITLLVFVFPLALDFAGPGFLRLIAVPFLVLDAGAATLAHLVGRSPGALGFMVGDTTIRSVTWGLGFLRRGQRTRRRLAIRSALALTILLVLFWNAQSCPERSAQCTRPLDAWRSALFHLDD